MLNRLIRNLTGRPATRSAAPAAPTLAQAMELMRTGNYAAAAVMCESVIASDARASAPWELLGAIAMAQGEQALACAHFENALRIGGEQLQTLCNAAEAYRQAGQAARALALCARALDLDAQSGAAMYIKALALQACWRMDEALAVYRELLRLQPAFSQAYAGYLFLLVLLGEDPLVLRDAHRSWAERHADPLLSGAEGHANPRDMGRRLRLGYVSADFREHAISSFIEPVLACHDRDAFEVYCYSNTERPDAITQKLQSLAAHWRDVRWNDDAATADLIRRDGIDLLVDLSGHTSGNRLGVFARKPAPVQIAYIGYPATTGMRAMDYRVTDSAADPPGVTDSYYTERLLRMPRTQWCFRPDAAMPPQTASLTAHAPIRFGSLNAAAKLTRGTIALWSQLIVSLPGSSLVLAAVGEGEARTRLRAEFARHGVSTDALAFHPPMDLKQFWNLHAQIDIALDAYPYNGATTTCVALWLGVPVVSLAGNRIWSRCGASLLAAVGLEELVAYTEEAFLQIALGLAQDRKRLTELRSGLRARMRASPLMDESGYTRDLEALYRLAWADWCESTGRA